MIRAGIVGATGYVGEELVRLLAQHPHVQLDVLTSQSFEGKPLEDVYGHFRDHSPGHCVAANLPAIAEHLDVIFLSLPHGLASQQVTEEILSRTKIIDLGADFRLKEAKTYEAWYNTSHHHPELLPKSVYGLTEFYREDIAKARLVGNPGCYPTCSLLTLLPIIQSGLIDPTRIIIDAKSGVTGAGRGLNLTTHFTECNESTKAYGFPAHRHTPEIEQGIQHLTGHPVALRFTPHLIPMNRGILTTAYTPIQPHALSTLTYQTLKSLYQKAYGDSPFIRLLPEGTFPETRWVKGSNFCDMAFHIDDRTQTLVMIGAIDNMMKGAAGQAVQNMNLMFNFPETTGLTPLPLFPA